MSLSELRRRKVIRGFYASDLTENGRLTVSDWIERINRTTAEFDIEPGSLEYQRLSKQQMDYWHQYQQAADLDQDNVITLGEWLQAHERIWAPDARDSFVATAHATSDALWELIDSDGDGRVDVDEFIRFYRCYINVGEDDSWVPELFHAIDTDGDGTLSKEAYAAALIDWAYSDDPAAPGNGLFGPY